MSNGWNSDDMDPTAAPPEAVEEIDPELTPQERGSGDEPAEEPALTPDQAAPDAVPVSAGPLTAPPDPAQRDLVPGVTDVAADIGYALGVGADAEGLVQVEVNGLLGVRVDLAPGIIPRGAEQCGHYLAAALEEARAEVSARLEEYFRASAVTAEWLQARPETGTDPVRGEGAELQGHDEAAPSQRMVTSPDGLVSVVVAADGSIASVVIADADLELEPVAQAFVVAAEAALQGAADGDPGPDADARIAQFDRVLAKLDASMDELNAQLDAALDKL